ncbi:hypothetical protein [Streptomyces sp. uw30]|nr:hypothetical protein [Streptomyces sp. uw30]
MKRGLDRWNGFLPYAVWSPPLMPRSSQHPGYPEPPSPPISVDGTV